MWRIAKTWRSLTAISISVSLLLVSLSVIAITPVLAKDHTKPTSTPTIMATATATDPCAVVTITGPGLNPCQPPCGGAATAVRDKGGKWQCKPKCDDNMPAVQDKDGKWQCKPRCDDGVAVQDKNGKRHCPSPTPTVLPSPSSMPDTATGGPSGPNDGNILLLGALLLLGGLGAAFMTRFTRRENFV